MGAILTGVNVAQPTSTRPVGYVVLAPSQLGAPSPLLADNIDPETHDFVSLFTSVHPIDAQVILAMKLERGSGAAVMQDGIRLRDITKMDDGAKNQIRSRIVQALSRLTKAGDIILKSVTFDVWDKSTQSGGPTVKYVNLRAYDNRIREIRAVLPNATG